MTERSVQTNLALTVSKMVAAGWCFTPIPEADDCVQCFYCGVSLDGWEPKDDPWYVMTVLYCPTPLLMLAPG